MTTGARKDPAGNPSGTSDRAGDVDTIASLRAELEARDQYLDLAGHQLRTPLTPATMLVHLMQADPALPEHLHEHVRMLRENIEREAMLIDELVDLARLSRGNLAVDRQSGVDLDGLLRDVVAEVKPDADAKRLQIRTSYGATRTQVVGDAVRLRRLLGTLLHNAIAHSVSGSIEVTLADGPDGTATVSVADHGCGISAEALSLLFMPFPPRTGPSRKATHIGAGLAIAAVVARLHGGSVSAVSDGPGRGAQFTLSVPAQIVPTMPE